jgi:GT2 family glycosyltransferase/tetratricopeptide (TPR) repeat protein/2-polyprenyl-3-methyl-5-hydroxy-6-metoxy-1,4-benzoquinol methylase
MAIQRVAIIFDNKARPETTGTYCRRALHHLVEVEHLLPSECYAAKQRTFDLFLNIDDGLSYDWPGELHPSVFWAIDTHLDFDACLAKARKFDFVFAAQRDGAERLRERGIATARWLPLACDPEIHAKHKVEKDFDLSFVGNVIGDERTKLLRLIQKRIRSAFVGQRYFDEMAKTYSASRIVFNRSIRNDINMRVFEALACGSMLLTNDLVENGQAELFEDGVHLATYRDADELFDKFKYYIAHSDLRERIASAGRNLVLEKHGYKHRMERILSEVSGQFSKRDVPVCTATNSPLDPKDRSYFEFSRPEIVACVPSSAKRVLDIGCGAGRVGESIKSRQLVHVSGIELDATAAALARARLDHVFEGNVEQMSLPFGSNEFDVVLCGDVLEHLRDPLSLLRKARGWLAPGGRVVASIPNVRHHSVIRGLLDGNWTYESAGLLDQDHVRFFTRREIEKLFFRAGFDTLELRVIPGPGYAEWVAHGKQGAVKAGRLHVGGLTAEEAEEFYVYQYLIVASISGEFVAQPREAHQPSPIHSNDNVDKVGTLAGEHPWPARKPTVAPPTGTDGWLEDGAREILRSVLSPTTKLVVELGTWLGKSTRFIADNAPNARVIAIDHWQGSPEHQKRAEWREMLPNLYESFLAMSWDYRERIIPLKMTTEDGLRLVARYGLSPDVIYVDSDHSYEAVKGDLELALQFFPKAIILGDDCDEAGASAALDEIARVNNKSIEFAGTNWRAWRLRDSKRMHVSLPKANDYGLTSIVIVTHNQIEYTRQCVDSITRLTDEPFELIFVDNNSTDGTVEYLSSLSQVTLIKNDQNRGFPAAANQGIRAATGDQVLLLNNDTVVTTGWLCRMLIALKNDPTIGLVGPCSNTVSGEQQVAVSYESLDGLDGFAWDWGQKNHRRMTDTDRLVGFCLLISHEVIEKIGHLDERFGIGCFEDDDYTMRARRAGFRAVIAWDSFVHHFGGRTFVGSRTDFAALMEDNRRKLLEKWNGDTPPETPGHSNGEPTTYEANRAPGGGLLLCRRPIHISLCMIARNNARTIRAALESVRDWMDEMIVVDTGSTDATPQIAASLGARVYHFPWRDDFSAARNESLKYARGKWIFYMDSDDVIDRENGRGLRDLALGTHAPNNMGYIVSVLCPGEGRNADFDTTVVTHVKLFRNLPQIRFDRYIHEQIIQSIRGIEGDIQFTKLFVVHSGYDRSPEGQKQKIERDLRLLHKELNDRPEDQFTLFNLGMTYANIGKYDEAIGYLERSIAQSSPSESQVRKAYALLGGAWARLTNLEKALQSYMKGLELFPLDDELRFQQAGTLHELGHLAESERTYLHLIEVREEQHFTSVDVGIATFKARQNLAAVYKEMGDIARAEEQWQSIVQEVPKYPEGWSGLADNLTQQGKHREALRAHEELVQLEPEDPSAHHNLGTTLLILQDWSAAARAFRESLRLRPGAASTWMHVGYACKNQGDNAGARAAFQEVIRIDPETSFAKEAGDHLRQMPN